MKKVILICFSCFSGSIPSQACSQDFYPTYIADGAMTAAAFNAAQESVKQQVIRNNPDVVDQDPNLNTSLYRQIAGKSAFAHNDIVKYKASDSVRKSNLAAFLSKAQKQDPAGGAQLQQLFASGDIINQIDQAIRPLGLRTNNVADAFALYWMSAWAAANGQDNHPTVNQARAVSAQAAAGLAATSAFKSATDAQKQELAEAMLVQAAMIDGYSDLADKDPSLKPQLAKAVRQGAKKMGLDLDAARLTEDGFVPTAKRSEADIAEPGVEPAQMAANADASPAAANDGEAIHPALWAFGGAGALAAAYGAGKLMGRKG